MPHRRALRGARAGARPEDITSIKQQPFQCGDGPLGGAEIAAGWILLRHLISDRCEFVAAITSPSRRCVLTATIYGGGCPDRTVSTKQTPHKSHRIRPFVRQTYVAKVFDFRFVVSVRVHRSGIVILILSFS